MRISDWSSDVCSSDLLADWSESDIAYALKIGMTPEGDFLSDAMGEVIENSTSHLSDSDLSSIAKYLKGLPAADAPCARLGRHCAPGRRVLDRTVVGWHRAAVPSDHVNTTIFKRVWQNTRVDGSLKAIHTDPYQLKAASGGGTPTGF